MVTTENKSSLSSLEIFPNPFTDLIKIRGLHNVNQEYRIYNTMGLLIQKGTLQIENGTGHLNTKGLGAGFYILTLIDNNEGKPFSYNLIKNKI